MLGRWCASPGARVMTKSVRHGWTLERLREEGKGREGKGAGVEFASVDELSIERQTISVMSSCSRNFTVISPHSTCHSNDVLIRKYSLFLPHLAPRLCFPLASVPSLPSSVCLLGCPPARLPSLPLDCPPTCCLSCSSSWCEWVAAASPTYWLRTICER